MPSHCTHRTVVLPSWGYGALPLFRQRKGDASATSPCRFSKNLERFSKNLEFFSKDLERFSKNSRNVQTFSDERLHVFGKGVRSGTMVAGVLPPRLYLGSRGCPPVAGV